MTTFKNASLFVLTVYIMLSSESFQIHSDSQLRQDNAQPCRLRESGPVDIQSESSNLHFNTIFWCACYSSQREWSEDSSSLDGNTGNNAEDGENDKLRQV